MNSRLSVAIGALVLHAPTLSAQQIYVDHDAAGLDNGSSWVHAFNDLQDALALASSTGEDIWVAGGSYTPSSSDRSASFHLVEGVQVLGAHAGAGVPGVDPDTRNTLLYTSVLSGEIQGDSRPTNNSFHVVQADDVDDVSLLAVLDGFTITDGYATVASGAGVFCDESWPTISNCIITGNTSTSTPSMHRGGGGVYCRETGDPGASPGEFLEIRSCTISNNDAEHYGGGVFVEAVANASAAGVAVLDSLIEDNTVDDDDSCGGGVSVLSDSTGATDPDVEVYVICCTIQGNTSKRDGGGISLKAHDRVDAWVINSVLSENTTDRFGGGLFNFLAVTSVLNCTFSLNVADLGGGIYTQPDAIEATLIENSILWGDTATTGGPELWADSTDVSVTHSDVEGGLGDVGGSTPMTWTNNADVDPFFVGTGADPYSLESNSLLVDKGDNADLVADEFDVDDNGDETEQTPDRVFNDRIDIYSLLVDMGAYETDCPCRTDTDASGDVGFVDLLNVLSDWGPCVAPGACTLYDFDFSGDVGFTDLLAVLATWGACPCDLGAYDSFEDILADAGLDADDWNVFVDCFQNGTSAEKANCACWLEHYLEDCVPSCPNLPDCEGEDPLANH